MCPIGVNGLHLRSMGDMTLWNIFILFFKKAIISIVHLVNKTLDLEHSTDFPARGPFDCVAFYQRKEKRRNKIERL